ncbi:LacI family transcriptional regulator [Pectobacterium carotovorum subsp. carotovorum]|jgi:DNA-binding LacI/PurR family transcriptional regulator|uniref:LacI family transcriptional regulator n=2 Tax=Pectobacterium versatile TaxID=2488639 RepID=A0A855MKS9_9GAMM|nr:LacI family transcriptional regulator [Pectobacterium versatile]GKV80403.1 LacI family transcriptional regulator [Pectobacterium carotovorum subsp. carotovorum]AVT58987.1 LacI family transcriptional regulator [Pectobacterium versatile]POY51273.1 LacI family transcriptional regulator [Pectobacterium versatile]POY56748.1 LacI family transcriptional regulator [Pectobacterium versatile]
MMSTINDVSRLAGVSKATVSRVLSGSRGVKEASRLAVLKAVDELKYRPNVIAQSLLSQSTGCIGVICAQDNINQTTGYLYALEKHFSRHQKHLLLRFASSRAEVMNVLDELTSGLCDDILIIGARFPLNLADKNIILIDCMETDTTNSLQFDHAFATETACNYLIRQGRRQIALINPAASSSAEQVLLGYKRALENNFLPFNRNLIFMDASSSSSVALQVLLNNSTTLNFNALLVADELEAKRVITQLQAFNKSVPKDIMVFSLAGSLDIPGIPAIPAIEYSMDAVAARIVSWLNEKTQDVLGSYVLRGDLIIPDMANRQ